MEPKQYILNVGGTRYKVSDSLLDRFPNSMLRKITSDLWNESGSDSAQPGQSREIFIERNGRRFKFIMDFMKYGKVALPWHIPRLQLINDMEYYGLNFEESQIVPDAAVNSDSMLHQFSEFSNHQRRIRTIFEPKREELENRYRELAAEKISIAIISKYFHDLSSDTLSMVEPRCISIEYEEHQPYTFSLRDLQGFLNEYGLRGFDCETLNYYRINEGIQLKVVNGEINKQNFQRVGEKTENTLQEETVSTQEQNTKQIKLNVGGMSYEVSLSLLKRFPDSMLSRIVSKIPEENEEIFIGRDGERFEFVLDYLRDGKVALPLTIFRPQLISDMKYFGIDFDDSQIILSVADPNDTFHQLSKYYYEKERFRDTFAHKIKDIEARYDKLVLENVSFGIASKYFEEQFSARSFTFEAKTIRKSLDSNKKERRDFSIKELQPHLNLYGLHGFDLRMHTGRYEVRPSYLELNVKMIL